jgi:hypothetical protein
LSSKDLFVFSWITPNDDSPIIGASCHFSSIDLFLNQTESNKDYAFVVVVLKYGRNYFIHELTFHWMDKIALSYGHFLGSISQFSNEVA